MASKYGSNYTLEWINDPSEQAERGSSNASVQGFYDEVAAVADGDDVFLCKIQHVMRFLGLESIVGDLGAGDVKIVDKDGNETVVVAGDLIDPALVEGGYDLVLEADADTDAALKFYAKFLMD
jgi:hypothetical protein